MSSRTIATLLHQLTEDPWRAEVGFSPEVQSALDLVLDPSKSDSEIATVLAAWLSKHQPCLFGRIAAKKDLLSYCIINEEVLADSDAVIAQKIQASRQEWTRLGFDGKASGFIIVLRSRALASAIPDATVQAIAQRLCSLYLQEDVAMDQVALDRIYLEQPGNRHTTWEWVTGVNYFSAQADNRWWRDHRIPAGMALSVNSVGHMVKSGKLARAIHDLEQVMETAQGDVANPVVESLDKALELAMLTIDRASDGPSGRATALLPRRSGIPKCPVSLKASLADKDHRGYQGWYHTDYTLPSEYFRPDVERPAAIRTHDLDFSYLFDQSLDNPDFDRMGRGRIIRDPSATTSVEVAEAYKWHKRLRGEPGEVEIDHVTRLREALFDH